MGAEGGERKGFSRKAWFSYIGPVLYFFFICLVSILKASHSLSLTVPYMLFPPPLPPPFFLPFLACFAFRDQQMPFERT